MEYWNNFAYSHAFGERKKLPWLYLDCYILWEPCLQLLLGPKLIFFLLVLKHSTELWKIPESTLELLGETWITTEEVTFTLMGVPSKVAFQIREQSFSNRVSSSSVCHLLLYSRSPLLIKNSDHRVSGYFMTLPSGTSDYTHPVTNEFIANFTPNIVHVYAE